MGQQLDVIREMIQKKIPDKKVRTVFYIGREIGNVLIYGLNNNSGHLFAVAKISPTGDIEIIR